MSSAVQLERQAAQWLLRREDEGWSPADQVALDAWLAESTANQVAYLRLEHGWRKVDRLVALRNPASMAPAPLPPVPSRSHRFRWAIAATVLLALAAASWHQLVLPPGSYATGIGEHEIVPLADGSRIELNTDTRVRAEVNDKTRTVWLERGEAYFDVKHVDSIPFVVYAGQRRITVLGTRFSVRRDGEQMRVVVAEGRVQVAELVAGHGQPPIIVTPGSMVRVAGAANLLEPSSPERAGRELSWRRGILQFSETTLADAALEFNRYNDRKLVILDPEVAGIRIGGSFEATNVEVFAQLLRDGFGLAVTEDGRTMKISQRRR